MDIRDSEMTLEQHSSQEERSQGTLILFLYLLLKCPPVPGRQKPGQVVCWVSDNKSILSDFVLVVLSAWLLQSDGARGKQGWEGCASWLTQNLPSVAPFQALSPTFPASAAFRMSKNLGCGLLRALAGSEGGEALPPPQSGVTAAGFENRLFSGFIGNLSRWDGNCLGSAITLTQRGPALIYGMCNHTETSFLIPFFSHWCWWV